MAFYFWVTVTFTLDLISRITVSALFEVGIQNLKCGCILVWGCVTYHFWVTVALLTLTSDHDPRIIMFGAYLLHF